MTTAQAKIKLRSDFLLYIYVFFYFESYLSTTKKNFTSYMYTDFIG